MSKTIVRSPLIFLILPLILNCSCRFCLFLFDGPLNRLFSLSWWSFLSYFFFSCSLLCSFFSLVAFVCFSFLFNSFSYLFSNRLRSFVYEYDYVVRRYFFLLKKKEVHKKENYSVNYRRIYSE